MPARISEAGLFGPPPIFQTFLPLGRDDEVDMVRHQAVRPHLEAPPLTLLLEKAQVRAVVLLLETDWLATVAPLGDVVGQAGDTDAGEAGHDTIFSGRPVPSWRIQSCVPRIPRTA